MTLIARIVSKKKRRQVVKKKVIDDEKRIGGKAIKANCQVMEAF